MASFNRKYVCLPEFDCICRPRGKAVSESTMLNHRRLANKERLDPLPRGPLYSNAAEVLRRYDELAVAAEHEAGTLTADVVGRQRLFNGVMSIDEHFEELEGTLNAVEVLHSSHAVPRTDNPQSDGHSGIELEPTGNQQRCRDFSGNNVEINLSDVSGESNPQRVEDDMSALSDTPESQVGGLNDNQTIDESLGDELDLELDDGYIEETPFHEWAKKNKKWIDLYLRHGLEYAVMDDILETASLGYKSWKTVLSHLRKDTGLQSALEYHTVCPGHMCFVHDPSGQSESDDMVCSECGKDETTVENKSRTRMGYIPLLPRLRAMIRDSSNCHDIFNYSRAWMSASGWKTDIFDGDLFKRIREKFHAGYGNPYDVYIGVSTDGFEVFEKGSCDVWPIIGIIYNLPPDKRFRMQNILPFAFVPGSKEPKNLQSFLLPLIHELEGINERGGTAMRFPDGSSHKVRVHLLWFTGDLPAIAKVGGLVGHNGKSPCRFCLQIGYYLVSSNRYYYPSQVKAVTEEDRERSSNGMVVLCHLRDAMARTEGAVSQTIRRLESLSGITRDELKRDTGIREDSVLFRLPTMFRYSSFPIDTMHLFYNVSRRLLEEIVLEGDEFYSLDRASLSRIDEELQQAGANISSQLGSRPRRLSLFKDWKASEHKDFLLSYSLVFFDGYLSDACMSGWAKFVTMADICFRPELEESDVETVHRLAIDFLEHFESTYFRYEQARLGKCKYVFHLLKHLAQNLQNCGPLVNCSQLWVERYIGWVKNRLHARHMAPEALFNNAVIIEAYKMYFREPFREEDRNDGVECDVEGLEVHGPHLTPLLSEGIYNMEPRLIRLLLDYFQRKFTGMSRSEAETAFSCIELIQESSRVKFLCGSQVMTAGSYSRYGDPERRNVRNRANWYIAAEMDESETCSDIYYGRLLHIYILRLGDNVPAEYSRKWPQWKTNFRVGLFDWVAGMEIGKYGQVFKSTEATNAFSAPTVEDLSIIRRLISVVNHVAPNSYARSQTRGNTARPIGRKRCYFIDGELSKDYLVQEGRFGRDGIDRNLRGVLRRHDR